jgi:hypothetical protein
VKDVLNDDYRPHPTSPRGGIWFTLSPLGELEGGCSYCKLFLAFAAYEDETLAGLIARLVENRIAVALGATNLFHINKIKIKIIKNG